MARVRRVTLRSFVLAFLLCVCGAAFATCTREVMCTTQAEAYAQCVTDGGPNYPCKFSDLGAPGYGGNPVCMGAPYNGWSYGGYSNTFSWYRWCVPSQCTVGTSPDGQTDFTMNDPGAYLSGGGVADEGGCCATLDFQQAGWGASDKSDAWATGHFVLNGSYCHTNLGSDTTGKIPKAAPLTPYSHCKAGEASCYNPFDDNFCSQSDSGEWFCVPRQPGSPGGCASGATGSACYARQPSSPPTPPDPPIQKGTPPTTTNNYTINDAGTTNNYTTNNYSGTSDGGGSASSSSSAGNQQSGGNQSNNSGNGNTGKNGTDSNGNCPNGSKPTASGCSGTYSDNGCDTPPACFGDAVMCGQARELHAIKCNTQKMAAASASSTSIGDPSAALAGAGVPSDGGASGDPGASGLVSSSDLGEDGFDSSGLGLSRTCPANPTFNVLGHAYEFDLSPFCNFASLLGWFVLLVACLVGLRIVATGKA